MRLGKATVVLVWMGWIVQGVVMAQQQDAGFEALLSDIGKEPAAVSTSVPAATTESVAVPAPAPAAVPAATSAQSAVESVAAEPPATEAIAAPGMEEITNSPAPEPVALGSPEAAAREPTPAETVQPATAEAAMPAAEMKAPESMTPEATSSAAVDAVQPVAESVQPAGEQAVPVQAQPEEAPAKAAVEEAVTTGAPAQENAEEVQPAVTPEQAKAMAVQEEVRRRAMELQGLKSLEAGYKAMAANDFQSAVKSFEDALANLPERPVRIEDRSRATWGLAEANYRIALDIYRKQGNLQEAKQDTERALKLSPDHKGAASLLEKIKYREEVLSRPLPPAKRPDVVEKKQTVAQLMSEGKQYFAIKDYNRAETLFEKVLIEDEYNVDAMRYLKKIEDIRLSIRTRERDAAAAGMMQEVRKAWNAPIRKEVQLPETVTGGAVVQSKTATQRLQDKMAKIMIPSIEFRTANITDVVNFLVEESIRQDMEGAGVNIILNLSIPGQEGASVSAPAVPAEGSTNPFEETPGGEGNLGAAPAGSMGVKTITLNLRRISLLDAIKYITEVASLKFRIEDNAVIITPAGVVSGRVITRMYPVQPSILDVVIQKGEAKEKTGEFIEMGGGNTTIKRGDVKEFFEKSGVPFPVGTSITYNPTISQLIVANTPENLDTFERILAQLNVIPSQIEIEARFVEVGENDLEELGLQWMLTDNWEVAQNKNTGERVQINADSDGFTKGLRFFGFDKSTAAIDPASTVTRSVNASPLGGILTAASVLTNPQLKVILQALSQHGNADLLSAPRVTTKNGVNAQIQIVKEYIYPTEFEVTQPTMGVSATAGGGGVSTLVTPPTVTPGSFETRETGVILNVTPAVGPDGYTIDLTMVPEVCELVDWIQYGSSITLAGETFVFNIPQPVFSSRNATTSIVIWDGQTVVLGGLIREELVTMRDKIPFLGDIPLLGRLFRSEGQNSKKMNLLIFVTARLVDPAGNPIHKAGGMAMAGGSSQSPAEKATK